MGVLTRCCGSILVRSQSGVCVLLVLTVTGFGQAQDDVQMTIEKLRRIAIPSIQLEDATLSKAIEFLGAQAKELDDLEPDPQEKGLRFVTDVPEGADAIRRITLDLNDVPLVVALRAVTGLAGCRYRVDASGVTIFSPEADRELYSRVYKLKPSLAGLLSTIGSELPKRQSVKGFLLKHGVGFPDGASATFDPVKSQLFVRNSKSNLDIVQTIIDQRQDEVRRAVRVVVEIYALPSESAQSVLEAGPDGQLIIELLEAYASEGKAALVASPKIVTSSGQRVSIQTGEPIEYISGYIAEDGKDRPAREIVHSGVSMTAEPVIGSDGFTVDVNIVVQQWVGEPKIEKLKSVAPVSGKEVEVGTVSVEQMTLKSSLVVWDGSPRLLGILDWSKEYPGETRFVVLKPTLVDPASGLPLRGN